MSTAPEVEILDEYVKLSSFVDAEDWGNGHCSWELLGLSTPMWNCECYKKRNYLET